MNKIMSHKIYRKICNSKYNNKIWEIKNKQQH